MFREWNPKLDLKYLGGISTAIYVMQYGIITAGTLMLKKFGLNETYFLWLVYIAVITVPTVLYWIFRNKKIVKIIF